MPLDLTGQLAKDLLDLTARLGARAEQDPFGNPVLLVALAISRRMDTHTLAEPDIAALIRHLRDAAFTDRAQRLATYVGGTDIQTRGTAAVPPVAAFAALWLGLGVLKRVTGAARGQDSNPDNSTDKAADSKPARSRWRRQRTTDRAPDKTPDTEPDKAPRRPRVLPDKVAAAVKRHPDWDDDRIAASCGVSAKTVKRRRAALATAQKAPTGT